jgi:hypothetical protein
MSDPSALENNASRQRTDVGSGPLTDVLQRQQPSHGAKQGSGQREEPAPPEMGCPRCR